jgi:hypothetical protein
MTTTGEIAIMIAETPPITAERPILLLALGCRSSLGGMALIGSYAVIGVRQRTLRRSLENTSDEKGGH